jgi:hypothetical protein
VVEPGESLLALALRYGVTVASIRETNKMGSSGASLECGQVWVALCSDVLYCGVLCCAMLCYAVT